VAVATLTQSQAAQAERARRYNIEITDLLGNMTRLDQIIAEDFPAPGASPETITAYHLAAIRGLKNGTGALLEGYDPHR
jgi:hypothetical protein